MGISTNLEWMRFSSSSLKLSLLLTLVMLNACQVESDRPMTLQTPELLRAIPDGDLSVSVVIDDQSVAYQGTLRDDGLWVVSVTVELDQEHTAIVSWYGLDGSEKILVAKQTSSFFASSSAAQANLTGSLETSGTPELDIDCDGVSNLQELSAGEDPSDGICETVVPNEPEVPVTTPDPDTIPIPETIAIEPGCFDMGSPVTEANRKEWETLHYICIEQRLNVGVYEVTFDQYYYFANQPENSEAVPYDDGLGSGSRPVKNIIWKHATSYAAWLSRVTGTNYRLLTEAEWEYVARAGTKTPYWTGEIISSTYENIFSDRIFEVGSLNQPNPWGFHDMLGNVHEWTCTSFQENYDGINENRCDADELVTKALRGGSFYSGAASSRSANRNNINPTIIDGGIGFRIVWVE